VALLAGVSLAVAALAYVLYPLFAAGGTGIGQVAPTTTPRGPGREVTDEEIEAAVRSYRARESTGIACPVCGARPESDAVYCSSCGRQLSVTAADA
jgi:hypothetical protein